MKADTDDLGSFFLCLVSNSYIDLQSYEPIQGCYGKGGVSFINSDSYILCNVINYPLGGTASIEVFILVKFSSSHILARWSRHVL